MNKLIVTMYQARHLNIFIRRKVKDVYDFVSIPENFRLWASGLGASLKKVHGEWVAETADGPVTVRFTEQNDFGILDHWVSLQPELQIYIPMRVIPNDNGTELIFTLLHMPGMSDDRFAADAAWVMRDLTTLKNLLEAS